MTRDDGAAPPPPAPTQPMRRAPRSALIRARSHGASASAAVGGTPPPPPLLLMDASAAIKRGTVKRAVAPAPPVSSTTSPNTEAAEPLDSWEDEEAFETRWTSPAWADRLLERGRVPAAAFLYDRLLAVSRGALATAAAGLQSLDAALDALRTASGALAKALPRLGDSHGLPDAAALATELAAREGYASVAPIAAANHASIRLTA